MPSNDFSQKKGLLRVSIRVLNTTGPFSLGLGPKTLNHNNRVKRRQLCAFQSPKRNPRYKTKTLVYIGRSLWHQHHHSNCLCERERERERERKWVAVQQVEERRGRRRGRASWSIARSRWRTRSWTSHPSRSSSRRGSRLAARPVPSANPSPSRGTRPRSPSPPIPASPKGNGVFSSRCWFWLYFLAALMFFFFWFIYRMGIHHQLILWLC